MSQIITDIYTHYKIPPNLQRHQLEVTAVGRYVCDHWRGDPVDRDKITRVLLLHDMGNILKFKRPFLGELEPQATYWESVQEDFQSRYGNDENAATYAICEEIGIDREIINAIKEISSYRFPDLESRISNYADMCVSPEGIVGFEKRMVDLKKRYGSADFSAKNDSRRQNATVIAQNVDVDLSHLSDVDFSAEIESLRHYSI